VSEQHLAAVIQVATLRDAAREATLLFARESTETNWELAVAAQRKLAAARRARDTLFGWREKTHATNTQDAFSV
jgi:hypothetical protein